MSCPIPPETFDRMKVQWLAGTAAKVIAADVAAEGIVLSASAVIGRMRRAGLAFMGPRSNWRAPVRKRCRKQRAVRKSDAAVVVKLAPAPRPGPRTKAASVAIPESRRVAIVDLRDGLCRWIAGDPRVDATACGHQTDPGSPYCAAHRFIGTVTPRARSAVYTPAFQRAA